MGSLLSRPPYHGTKGHLTTQTVLQSKVDKLRQQSALAPTKIFPKGGIDDYVCIVCVRVHQTKLLCVHMAPVQNGRTLGAGRCVLLITLYGFIAKQSNNLWKIIVLENPNFWV